MMSEPPACHAGEIRVLYAAVKILGGLTVKMSVRSARKIKHASKC